MDATQITNLVCAVTKKWAKQRKAEERESSARLRRSQAFNRSYRETIKDVAWEVMESAYMKASSSGKLPALARQIMYAARGEIQERTGEPLDDQYFIQTLLPNYMNAHPEETRDWNVVFDARGHLTEPHTEEVIPLGTLDVKKYLRGIDRGSIDSSGFNVHYDELVPTHGPRNRFGAILFIEKEGFMPLFEVVKLGERYDIAIMSTKGMSVTASRLLVDQLCCQEGVPLLVLHDFDKSGFSILGTLQRDTRRYEFQNQVKVVDLGLRLVDVEMYGLQSEEVCYKSDPTQNLRKNEATEEEIAFLYEGDLRGRRVELNAFTSDQLVEWIESKLKLYGIKKVIPDDETLEKAYRRSLEIELVREEIAKIEDAVRDRVSEAKVPKGLALKVAKRLKASPEIPWDRAVAMEVKSDE
jgi:hypothetical protein